VEGERAPQRHFPVRDVYAACVQQGNKAFVTYTGFTRPQFDELLGELRDLIERNRHVRLNVPEPNEEHRATKATTENRLLMALKFLTRGGTEAELGVEFGVSAKVVCEDLFHVIS
jgi:hypothetical protein